MKASDNFKKIISQHLEGLAASDALFAETLKKENKNIDECMTYIINTVKESGQAGFADEEIFGMAVHYYDEDDIKVGKPIQCKVVVNHTVDLSEEEKQAAKQAAIDKVMAEEKAKIANRKPAAKKEVQPQFAQPSLWD